MARLTGGSSLGIDSRRNQGDEGDEAPVSLTRQARGCFAPKQLAPASLGAPDSAWVRLLGMQLGHFFGVGAKKSSEKAFLGARLEMLLAFGRVLASLAMSTGTACLTSNPKLLISTTVQQCRCLWKS